MARRAGKDVLGEGAVGPAVVAEVQGNGGLLRLATCCGVAFLIALGAAGAATAQEPSTRADVRERLARLLVTEPPTGFDQRTTPAVADDLDELAVGYGRTFEGAPKERRGKLTLVLWDATATPFGTDYVFARFRAIAEQEPRFDAAGVHRDAIGWRAEDTVEGETWVGHMVVVRHGGLIVEARHWAPPDYPLAAVEAQLRELVRRQLRRPTVPAPSVRIPPEFAYLDRVTLTEPGLAPSGHQFVLLPALSGPVTAEQTRRWGLDEQVTSQAAELEGSLRGLRRHWAEPERGTELVLVVTDLGSEEKAGMTLHDASLRGTPLGGQADAFVLPAGRVASGPELPLRVVGRRGRFFITVAPTGLEPRDVLVDVAATALERQRTLLGEGGTSALAQNEAYLQGQIYGALLFILLCVAGIRVLGARWARQPVRLRSAAVADGAVVSVAANARRLRRSGLALGVALLVVAAVTIGSLSPPRWKLLLTLAVLTLFYAMLLRRRRAERPERWARVGLRRPRLIRSAVLGGLSVLVLAVAVPLALAGAVGSIFGPSLTDADLEREYGIDLSALEPLIVLLVLLLAAALSAALFRAARRQARLRADELRRLDDRPPVLYLRAFTDDRLKIPSIVSGRRPIAELLSPAVRDGYESVVAWELDAAGPTMTIAEVRGGLGSLGAAREYAPADWQTFVASRMQASRFIAVSIGRSQGVLWELEQLADRELLDRALFLFPPVAASELQARWQTVAGALKRSGAISCEPTLDPASTLVAIIEDGCPLAFTADQRDEAGYRAAIAAALARLDARAGLQAETALEPSSGVTPAAARVPPSA